MQRLVLLLTLAAILTVGCATKTTAVTTTEAAPTEQSYAGDWMLNISDTPLGKVQGILTLEVDPAQVYQGKITINGGDFPLKTVQVEGNKVRASFFHAHYGLDIQIDLLGEAIGPLKGRMNNEYATIAERV